MADYYLQYSNKKTAEQILKETPIIPYKLVKEVKGSEHFADNNWSNKLFFGGNLGVLKALYSDPKVKGKVDLIYIDPPFATNQSFRAGKKRTSTISASKDDAVAYHDRKIGAAYFEFIRERLVFLRELLSEKGSIYFHIDSKIGHYIKILMDEVFGEENFVNDIARIKCNPKNFSRKGFGNIKDMILFYSKSDNYIWNGSREDYTKEDLKRLFKKVDQKGRRYTTNPLHAPGETKNGATGKAWKGKLPPKGRHWRYPPEELTRLDEEGLIEWSKNGNPRKIIYAEEHRKKKKKRQDIWTFKDKQNPSYPTQKNLELLKVIIRASSNKHSIVLDCFAGSGTTIIAAEKLQRKWIAVDASQIAIHTITKRLAKLHNKASYKLFASSDNPMIDKKKYDNEESNTNS